MDEYVGKFAFREVTLCQQPYDQTRMQYQLQINGKNVFVKGSNWVPAECFIGSITTEKYQRLLGQAAKANFNMLRVWGGGPAPIYPKTTQGLLMLARRRLPIRFADCATIRHWYIGAEAMKKQDPTGLKSPRETTLLT